MPCPKTRPAADRQPAPIEVRRRRNITELSTSAQPTRRQAIAATTPAQPSANSRRGPRTVSRQEAHPVLLGLLGASLFLYLSRTVPVV
jgi:hypothetical protein